MGQRLGQFMPSTPDDFQRLRGLQIQIQDEVARQYEDLQKFAQSLEYLSRCIGDLNERVKTLEDHPSNGMEELRRLSTPRKAGLGGGVLLFFGGIAAFIFAGGFSIEVGGVKLQRPEMSGAAITAIVAGAGASLAAAKGSSE